MNQAKGELDEVNYEFFKGKWENRVLDSSLALRMTAWFVVQGRSAALVSSRARKLPPLTALL